MRNIRAFTNGLQLISVASSQISAEGEMEVFSNRLRIYLSGAVHEVTTNDQVQTLTNKTYASPVFTGALTLPEIATPSTPASGFGKIYFKTDNLLYQLDDAGAETRIGAPPTFTAFGSTPNSAGASISGFAITLQPASATQPGGLSTGAQSIAGAKTFTGAITASNLSGTNTGDQTITLTGDVTGSGTGSFAATIANDAVSNAKLANMATSTIKGRVTGGTGDPEDLTGTQATTLLDAFTSSLKGLAPASGGGTTNFLRADGTWAAPADTGITTLNTLTATTQTFAVGTTGSDFNISSATSTHTFNIPDAGASARGLVTTGSQTIAGAKTLSSALLLKTSLVIEDPGAGTDTVTIVAPTLSGSYTLTLPVDDGTSNQVLTTNGSGVLSWTTPSSSGANTALSNLASVAINTSLLPAVDNTIDLGSSAKNWSSVYVNNVRDGSGTLVMSVNGGTINSSTTGLLSIDFNNFLLADSAELTAVNWNTRELVRDNGSTTVLNWAGANLTVPVNLLLKTSLSIEDPGAGTNSVTIQAPTLAGSYTLTLPPDDGATGQFLRTDGSGVLTWVTPGAGTGDVVGPASASDNAICRFDGSTGKLIQNSAVSITDAGVLSVDPTSLPSDSTIAALFVDADTTNTGSGGGAVSGILVTTDASVANQPAELYGISNTTTYGAGVTSVLGNYSVVSGTGSSPSASIYGEYIDITTANGTIANAYGLYIQGVSGGTVSGVNRALHVQDGDSFFNDNVLINGQLKRSNDGTNFVTEIYTDSVSLTGSSTVTAYSYAAASFTAAQVEYSITSNAGNVRTGKLYIVAKSDGSGIQYNDQSVETADVQVTLTADFSTPNIRIRAANANASAGTMRLDVKLFRT